MLLVPRWESARQGGGLGLLLVQVDLARPLPMSLPSVMQHLQVLEAAGLVRSEKVGRVRTCRIEPGALRSAEVWINRQRTTWERRLDRLGDVLVEHPDPAQPAPGLDPEQTPQQGENP